MTAELRAFLAARLDEDEAAAGAASPAPWTYGDVDSVAGGSLYDATRMIGGVYYEQPEYHDGSIVRHLLSPEADANGAHIARWDPARVLAHVRACRSILTLAEQEHRDADANRGPATGWDVIHAARARAFDAAVRALAAPYAGHPDARPEWGLR